MKKRLFTMLLLLCLLLTALTATVAAESTNANGGHLEFTFNGRTVTFVLSFNYVCENKHNTHDGYFTYNLNSVQAKKADGTLVSMAEWKPEDTIRADITVSGIHCYVCDEKIDGTITKTVEFTGADVANFCHLTRNSDNALTAEMQHIRGADTNDRMAPHPVLVVCAAWELSLILMMNISPMAFFSAWMTLHRREPCVTLRFLMAAVSLSQLRYPEKSIRSLPTMSVKWNASAKKNTDIVTPVPGTPV